jgi:hypothetical protein
MSAERPRRAIGAFRQRRKKAIIYKHKQEIRSEQNQISRMPIIESPCCTAPSTPMNTVISIAHSKDRRCVRCRQVFCRIDVDDGERPRKALVGARAE